jgi:hypothetical protein
MASLSFVLLRISLNASTHLLSTNDQRYSLNEVIVQSVCNDLMTLAYLITLYPSFAPLDCLTPRIQSKRLIMLSPSSPFVCLSFG